MRAAFGSLGFPWNVDAHTTILGIKRCSTFMILRDIQFHIGSENIPLPFEPDRHSVFTELCDVHYWYQGSGHLLVFIPGGNGISRQFNPSFEHLDKQFTVCSCDRRQFNDSRVAGPKQLNPAQQARDVIAICNALDRDKISVFGNSGGGIIALQFAVSYPEYLDRVMSTKRRRLYYSTMPRTISTEHLCSSASIGHSVVKAAFQRISHRDEGIRR
jgi:hypothetical protein